MPLTLNTALDRGRNSPEPRQRDVIQYGMRQALLQPMVFDYADLWQHPLPLLDALRQAAGSTPLAHLGGVYGWSVRYAQVEDYEQLNVKTLADYIDAFRASDTRLPYLRHISLNKSAPALRKHIHDPVAFTPNWVDHPVLDRLGGPELFIGQRGTSFGHVHRDHVHVHVGFVQLQGEKEFVLFPPGDGPYLYRCPGREFPFEQRATKIHHSELHDYEQFPLLKKASPRRVVLRAGQAMLMPAGWFHTTYNHSDSVSYSIRIVNATNALRTAMMHIEGIPRWLRKLRKKA